MDRSNTKLNLIKKDINVGGCRCPASRLNKMKIIDTYEQIGFCFSDGKFNKELWEKYIQAIHPEAKKLIETDSEDYDYEKDIMPIMNAVVNSHDKLEILHNSFYKATKNLNKKIQEKFHVELDVTLILYFGLCNGAGWATKLGDKKVIMLGIEKILELNWIDEISMAALIYHELGHIWHYSERRVETITASPILQAIWKLYTEGMAMYFEQLLMGRKFYHQNKAGWLNWCEKNKKMLVDNYIRRVEGGETIQDYFGDWHNIEGYSDVGYFLGAEFIWSLSEKYSDAEISNLSLDKIWKEFKRFL